MYCPYCNESIKNPASIRRHYKQKKNCGRQHAIFTQWLRQPPHLRPEFPPHLQLRHRGTPSTPASNEVDTPIAHDYGRLVEDNDEREDDWMDIDEGAGHQAHSPMSVYEPDPPNQQHHLPVQDQPEVFCSQSKLHGYASVEVHPDGARVIRWEYDDGPEQPPNPEDVLRQKRYFEICEWLMHQPLSNAARTEFLNLEMIKDEGLPWKNLEDMLKSVDSLEHGPEWKTRSLTLRAREGEETFLVRFRCALEVVRHLISLRRLVKHMRFKPEKHFTTTVDGRRIRVYSEMWTGDWWWRMQNLLGEGATVVPFIVATDATQLTKISGSKYAWPVYATIGNICSHVRRRPSEHAMVLIGYIPVAKLEWITDEEERRQKKWELYHAAMSMILEPLRNAARQGAEMRCADGGVRRVHPILSTQIGDWPELCTAGVCQNTRCPVCVAPFSARGNLQQQPWRLRTKPEILTAFDYARRGFVGMQVGLGLRPTWPYWAHHPWSSGPSGFVPDLLHQLWKGMFLTHLKTWWTKLLGRSELDERYAGIPRYSTQRHFGSISSITQWTGNEARGLARVFLPIVAGDFPRLAVRAARGMMDFIYRARQPQLDDDDLGELDNDLREFHTSKWIFRSRGVHTARYKFNGIAKLHMLEHYTRQIREFGAPCGYSTEIPERLHIDYVKHPYSTTNGINPLEQMILNLQRSEALVMRRAELERSGAIQPRKRRYQPTSDDICDGDGENDCDNTDEDDCENTGNHENYNNPGCEGDRAQPLANRKERFVYHPRPQIVTSKAPTDTNVNISTITAQHRAQGFLEALRLYVEVHSPNLAFQLNPQTKLGVYSWFKLVHNRLPFAPLTGGKTDLVRATPVRRNRHGIMTRAPCFDTVLLEHDYDALGLSRYCAARVLVIFSLPTWFHSIYSEPLAYVEVFDKFTAPGTPHGLSTTKPLLSRGQRVRKVVPLWKIRMTCQLVPRYSRLRQQFPNLRITSETDTLSIADRFFLNRHVSYYFFSLTDHWRRVVPPHH